MSFDGPAGRDPAAQGTLCLGGAAGRRLCRCDLFPGLRFFGTDPGKAGRRYPDGADRLWRRGAAFSDAAAPVRHVLRPGRLHSGPWFTGRIGCAAHQRYFLYQCGYKSAAAGRHRGISSGAPCILRGSKTRLPRRAAAGADRAGRELRGSDGSVGQRQPAARAGERQGRSGGPRRCDPAGFTAAGHQAADQVSLPGAGRRPGTVDEGGTAAAAPAAALSRSWHCCRAAAGCSDRLDGDRRGALSGTDGGALPRRIGKRICCALGRRHGKGRKA